GVDVPAAALPDGIDLEVPAEPRAVVAEAVVVEGELGIPPVAGEAQGLVEIGADGDVRSAVRLDVRLPHDDAEVVDDTLGAAALVTEEIVARAARGVRVL